MRAGVAHRADLALEGALAEAAGHQDAVHRPQHLFDVAVVELFAIDKMHVDLGVVVYTCMMQRLDDRKIRVGQARVLADDGHVAVMLHMGGRVHERAQRTQVDLALGKAQTFEHLHVEMLVVQAERHLVDGRAVGARKHLVGPYVAEQGDLLAHLVRDLVVAAAYDEVGLHADGAQLLDGMLRGLSLHFVGCGDVRDQRDVDEQHVAALLFLPELTRGLDEGLRLDVADGAADLGDDDVGAGLVGDAAQALLDGLGDVRNHLHSAAEEVAATLAGDKSFVNGALREVRFARQVLVDEALVMPQVKIAFVTVFGDEDLAMLKRAHGARVHVKVWVHLLHGHLVAASLQQMPQGGGRDALAQRRHDAAGYENMLGHSSPSRLETGVFPTADRAAPRPIRLQHANGKLQTLVYCTRRVTSPPAPREPFNRGETKPKRDGRQGRPRRLSGLCGTGPAKPNVIMPDRRTCHCASLRLLYRTRSLWLHLRFSRVDGHISSRFRARALYWFG